MSIGFSSVEILDDLSKKLLVESGVMEAILDGVKERRQGMEMGDWKGC